MAISQKLLKLESSNLYQNDQKGHVYICPKSSGVARGASGGTHPGAQALGAHQHTFCSHLKSHFKQKFRQKYA